jgi:hypothetical protein
MASILDILAWRNISTSVQKVETGIPDRLPAQFKSLTEDVLGDRTTYVTFYGQRGVARRAEYGAPSRPRTLKQLGEQSVTLLHFTEHVKIRQELLLRLRQPNDVMAQQMAQMEIARHGADFRQVFDNTRLATITFLLGGGKVWFDSTGAVLPTSSGAAFTMDLGIAAANLNQLGGIIDASWATDTTNIIQHLTNIEVQMKKNTGRTMKHAFYGKNVAAYLFKNTTLGKYWQYNSKMYDAFAAAPKFVPDGFAGLTWHYMGDTYYDDADGTTRDIWGADKVTFTPEIDRNFYTLYEGSIAVPKSFGINPDVVSGAENFEIQYGMAGYAVPEIDPVGVKAVYADTFLPAFKTATVNGTGAGDMFQATVAF